MRAPILPLLALGIAIVGLSAAAFAPSAPLFHLGAFFQDSKGHDESVDVMKLPAAVQATAKKVFGKLDGLKASQEKEGGTILFEVEGKGADGMDVSFTCPDNGHIYQLERGVAIGSLPGDAGKNLLKQFPGATLVSACEVEQHYFEVKMQKDGKPQEAMVGVSGRIYQEEQGEEEEGEEEEGEEGR